MILKLDTTKEESIYRSLDKAINKREEAVIMKRRIVIPKTVSQHVEEEFRKNADFRKAYDEEVARLQIGFKIGRLRQLRRLSQAGLAKKVNTTQQTISRLEDLRNSRINIRTLAKIAAALRARLSVDFIPREVNA